MVRQCMCAESDKCRDAGFDEVPNCYRSCSDHLSVYGANTTDLTGCFITHIAPKVQQAKTCMKMHMLEKYDVQLTGPSP